MAATWWLRIRELADGLTRRAPGGCPGDPVAWEREYRRRLSETAEAEEKAATGIETR